MLCLVNKLAISLFCYHVIVMTLIKTAWPSLISAFPDTWFTLSSGLADRSFRPPHLRYVFSDSTHNTEGLQRGSPMDVTSV